MRKLITELLVLRAQAGEKDAIELLVREWQSRLHTHARRMTGDPGGADDVSQEAWIAILRGLRSLEDPECFGPWAYRIVSLASAEWIRKRSRQRNREHRMADVAAPVQREAAAENDVRAMLNKLPADQQAILHLRYVEEYRIQQIADALVIPAGTVKSRLFNAREHLREILERSERR